MSRDAQIIRMVKKGLSYKQVAESLGLSRGAVSGVCFRAGISAKPKHITRNRSEAQKGKPKFALRGRVVSERATKAVEMRQAGMGYAKIALELGYADASGPFIAIKRREQASEAAE
jgi:hypothetical protein